MLKKSILMIAMVTTQMSSAAPGQYQTINKLYDLSCETNKDGKTFSSSLTLNTTSSDVDVFLVLSSNILGPSDISFSLANQKFLDYKSEDTFPKTYNYTETKFPENQIIYNDTVKVGFFGKERLQTGLHITFSDANLNKGSLILTTYWPKTNNVTVCSLTEK